MPIRSAAQTHPAALVVALSLALLPAAPRAAAQGTFSLLPDPITSLDLIRYAERLALSPDQRLTAEAAHDEYKRHFKALRDGEIEELLKSRATLQSGGVMAAERGRQAVLDELDRLRRRIRSLDDSFFGGLDGALTDEQRLTLARLRLLRERCRYASNQFISTNHPVTDLGGTQGRARGPGAQLGRDRLVHAPGRLGVTEVVEQ